MLSRLAVPPRIQGTPCNLEALAWIRFRKCGHKGGTVLVRDARLKLVDEVVGEHHVAQLLTKFAPRHPSELQVRPEMLDCLEIPGLRGRFQGPQEKARDPAKPRLAGGAFS